MKLGVMGDGRAARALVPRLEQAGHRISWRWSRRHGTPVADLAAVDVVLIAVTDGAIDEVSMALSERVSAAGEVWLHLSGALPSSVARTDATRPHAVGTLHPMVALTGDAENPAQLTGATCGVAGDPRAVDMARQLGRDLGMRTVDINDERRALYHAAAVSVAGHATALLAQAVGMLERVGLEPSEAQTALTALMESALANARVGPLSAQITGPVARGDSETVALHLDAIAELYPEALPAYLSLARASLDLSASTLPRPAYDAIARELDRLSPSARASRPSD